MEETFAVFKMRAWQREHHPAEIFHDLLEARRFAASLQATVSPEEPTVEWRVFRRSRTDWVKLSDFWLND